MRTKILVAALLSSFASLSFAASNVTLYGQLIDRINLQPGEMIKKQMVRFRTLGCWPLTGAVESNAQTLPEIIEEMLVSTTSERQGRVIDRDQAGSMELKKRQGYF